MNLASFPTGNILHTPCAAVFQEELNMPHNNGGENSVVCSGFQMSVDSQNYAYVRATYC